MFDYFYNVDININEIKSIFQLQLNNLIFQILYIEIFINILA